MKLWRIAAETRRYSATDLGGGGAALYPGRWNEEGQAVVYCALSMAVAVLETAAHIDAAGLPQNRFIVEIDVPPDLWALREVVSAEDLPAAWAAIPAGRASVRVGAAWLSACRSPILLVPSVIVPEEFVALLNPGHALASRIKARMLRPFDYDRLFRR